jgi:drug/metabolite transporter (DMT)-like permease
MLILLTVLNKIAGPYWNTLRKSLAEKGNAPITIAHAPNLITHPIGIAILAFMGIFALPRDHLFFFFWFGMIIIAAITTTFSILGLLQAKFFATQVIGSLGFAASLLFASFLLGETMSRMQIFSLCLAVAGVILFLLPKKREDYFVIDKGVVFIIISVILGGLSSVLYKLASHHVTSYASFLGGRFIGDLIGWTIVWLISLRILRIRPLADLGVVVRDRSGFILILGTSVVTLIDSWLIYKLPISLVAMIGTLAFPVSYFISRYKYKEHITLNMWLGTLAIIGSVILFIATK